MWRYLLSTQHIHLDSLFISPDSSDSALLRVRMNSPSLWTFCDLHSIHFETVHSPQLLIMLLCFSHNILYVVCAQIVFSIDRMSLIALSFSMEEELKMRYTSMMTLFIPSRKVLLHLLCFIFWTLCTDHYQQSKHYWIYKEIILF